MDTSGLAWLMMIGAVAIAVVYGAVMGVQWVIRKLKGGK